MKYRLNVYRFYPDTAVEGGIVLESRQEYASEDALIAAFCARSNEGYFCTLELVK